MEPTFVRIKEEFQRRDQQLHTRFQMTVRDTEKGIWGASDLDVVLELFQKIGLDKAKNFMDIGCGDGRVVLVASFFTHAFGIEFDEELVETGNKIKENLHSTNAELFRGDFFSHDFSGYDVLFINPDTGFYNGLEDKLLKEMKGTLFVYNNIFLPRFLKRGKTYWIGQVPITEFRNER